MSLANIKIGNSPVSAKKFVLKRSKIVRTTFVYSLTTMAFDWVVFSYLCPVFYRCTYVRQTVLLQRHAATAACRNPTN